MNLAEEAFQQLYPGRGLEYSITLKYSAKFKSYNANVKKLGNMLVFNLSNKWAKISKEIQIGLIQELILKLFKDKKRAINIDIYNNFIKNIHLALPKTESNPILEASFNRVNETYFYGLMEKPNLAFSGYSSNRLGSYEYGTDTISISEILLRAPVRLLDYIMYHELLHKKYKFTAKNNRNHHHSREFKKGEQDYKDFRHVEKELNLFLEKIIRKS